MKVFVAPGPDDTGKFEGVVRAFPQVWRGSVLDVGCRSGNLHRVLSSSDVKYCGLDLYPPASVIGHLGSGLPFAQESFDTVVALDVLEHTDDIYRSFGELCRVAREYVVVTLPNALEITKRLKFLLGHSLGGKYGLPTEPPRDRHRWLFSLAEAIEFCRARTKQYGFQVLDEGCLIGPRRGFALGKLAVSVFPNLLSPTYLVLLGRKKQEGLGKS